MYQILAELIGIDLENEPELLWVAEVRKPASAQQRRLLPACSHASKPCIGGCKDLWTGTLDSVPLLWCRGLGLKKGSVQECHKAPIRPPWARFADPETQAVYFWNRNTRESTWEHPNKLDFKRRVKQERAALNQRMAVEKLTGKRRDSEVSAARSKARNAQHEAMFIPSADRLAVMLPSLTPMIRQMERTPPSWELELVAMHGTYKYGRRTIPWYHARLRSCQVQPSPGKPRRCRRTAAL